MFCLSQFNDSINKIKERALQIAKRFPNLISKQHEFTIHQMNLQLHMTKIYEITENIFPTMTKLLPVNIYKDN